MASNDIYKMTAKRLTGYDLFSNKTIKVIANLAQKQSEYKKYQTFFNDAGLPKVSLFTTKKGSGVPVIDIPPKTKTTKGTIVIHLPMGNALDESQLYQVATVATANDSYRVIAFGNPSGPPYKYRQQNLTFWKYFKIAFSKDTSSLVEIELEYLKDAKNIYHIGYSYGALKALIESYYSEQNSVKGIIVIEPVAHSRSLKQLAGDFRNTFKPLGNYVNRTKIPTYFDARNEAAKKSGTTSQTLLRPINIAIAILLARSDLIKLLTQVMARQNLSIIMIAWASESELGNDAHIKANIHNLTHANSKVHAMRLEGDKHAVANDVHLYAAIVRQALQG